MHGMPPRSGRIAATIATALRSRMPSQPDSAAAAGSALPPLVLKPQEERRLHAGHLWIFSNEVDTERDAAHGVRAGRARRSASSSDRFLGYAYVNPRTLISARLLGRDPAYPPGKSLLVHRLKVALALRERLAVAPFYRLVYGEGDLLPGLVVDRYGDVLVAQIGTAGMEAMKADDRGGARQGASRRARCCGRTIRRSASSKASPRYVETAFGELPDAVDVPEGGVNFRVPLAARAEDRLVLRPDREPRAVRAPRPRRAGARRLQLRRRVRPAGRRARARGGRPASTRPAPALAAASAHGRRQRPRCRAAGRRCLRGARGAARRATPLRRRRRRSARVHQAQEGPPEGARGLPPHQPARDAAARPRRAADVLLLLVSPRARRAGRCRPARGAPPRPLRAADRRRAASRRTIRCIRRSTRRATCAPSCSG